METLFYTEARGSLVFSPPAVAEYVSQIHKALRAPTWGEMKAMLPKGELEKLEPYFSVDEQGDVEYPDDDSSYPADFIPGFADGDYPRWLQSEQDKFIPSDVLGRFGIRETSILNGDFWIIDPSKEASLVCELQARGIEAIRRDDLVFY